MATLPVAVGKIGVYEHAMAAATVDSVQFDEDIDAVEVVSHDGTAAVYFTVDGTTPTVGGANCWMVPAAYASRTVEVPTGGKTVVKLISAGTPTVSVARSSGHV